MKKNSMRNMEKVLTCYGCLFYYIWRIKKCSLLRFKLTNVFTMIALFFYFRILAALRTPLCYVKNKRLAFGYSSSTAFGVRFCSVNANSPPSCSYDQTDFIFLSKIFFVPFLHLFFFFSTFSLKQFK